MKKLYYSTMKVNAKILFVCKKIHQPFFLTIVSKLSKINKLFYLVRSIRVVLKNKQIKKIISQTVFIKTVYKNRPNKK